MTKSITLAQLHNWLKENSHLTWSMSEIYGEGAFGSKHPNASPIIKYVFPSLDLRTGTIYQLTVEGFSKYIVSHVEEFDGNLLELLEHKIKNQLSVAKDVDEYEYIRQIQIDKFNKDSKDAKSR